jgi:3-hydroxyisobutyrate dehydrogenase-like beta-hydroxyacid dehydrogenase
LIVLGFLGLGAMGSEMAGRLVDGGQQVVVWNRTPGAADKLVKRGAARADSAAEALAADFSFSMLANDAAALDVLSDDNLAAALGKIHLSMSSLSPATAGVIAGRAGQADVRFAAAPVIGRPQAAAAGQLNVLVAGDGKAIAEAGPFLEMMAQRVWNLGDDPRSAAVAKIAVNYNIIHAIQAIGESVTLAEANGIEAAAFVELLTSTLFGGVAYSIYGRLIASQSYRPAGFSMQLGRKDLGLAEGVAADAGIALPTLPALKELFEEALADADLAQDDWAALAELTRRRARG